MKKLISFALSVIIIVMSLFSTTAFAQEQTRYEKWCQNYSTNEFEANLYSKIGDESAEYHFYLKDNKAAFTTVIPITSNNTDEITCIYDGNSFNLFIHSMPLFYFKFDANDFSFEEVYEMFNNAETEYTFIKSYEYNQGNTTYFVEEYSYNIEVEDYSEQGTAKYYFIGDELIISESYFIDENGNSVYHRLEYLSYEVDDSVFKIPWYSINILPILEFVLSLFYISIII